jgi:hypothetical protein
MGKTRPQDKPWLVVSDGDWEWRVLKAYSLDPDKQYARWFCAVKSPFTYGSFEMGDTYIADIDGVITFCDPDVPREAIPVGLATRGIPKMTSIGTLLSLLALPR